MDWGSKNIVATAFGHSVQLWDASNGSTSELVTSSADDDQSGPVTALRWAPDGRHIAVGVKNSDIQLWDATADRRLRTLRQPVASLAWSGDVLSAGGTDGLITNNDVRVKSHVVDTYRGHAGEVLSLQWSGFGMGRHLASGGSDHLVHVWDRSMASAPAPRWLHRIDRHGSAVESLAWCPFQSNLLASGGDHRIMLWNIHTGALAGSAGTGSRVRSLLWNKNAGELLSSDGSAHDRLSLWKYPSMVGMARPIRFTDVSPENPNHRRTESRVSFVSFCQSPDGCTIASAAGDRTLRLCDVFRAKPAPRNPEPVYKSLLLCR